mgnify:CR=1 FL=1
MKGDEIKYSYWSNFNNSRNKNIGWRIDYFIVSPSLKEKINNCDILTEMHASKELAPLFE